jgi:hypothetical protein
MPEIQARIPVREPGTLIAIVPHLLGFHPADSIVLIGTTGPHALIRLVFRYELPREPDPAVPQSIAGHALEVLHREKLNTAALIGYGPGTLVTPVADVLRHALPRDGIRLFEMLRVQDGRYWSYLCTQPSCCPPEGRPLHPADPAAIILAGYGLTALASRQHLAATIAPVTGPAAGTMARATRQAAENAARDLAALGQDTLTRKLLDTVQDAITRYRDGETITDPAELAALTVALGPAQVRDDAWARMQPAHLRLWTDLTRCAAPGYVAAPASLLAFTAWQDGNGPLGHVALDRAQADDPDYTMAHLLRDALSAGLSPSLAVLSMTPEEVADSYQNPAQDK